MVNTQIRQLYARHFGRDARLRESNITDDMSNTVKGALTASHPTPSNNQIDESGVVNSELTLSQVSQEPAQRQGPGAVVRCTLATLAMIPNIKSRNVVVRRAKPTRRIVKTIEGTSKRVAFGSVSVQEDGPTNEMFEAVEDKMPEASSTEVLQHGFLAAKDIVNLSEMTKVRFLSELKGGKIHDIVAPFPKMNLEYYCSFSAMNDSVLKTDNPQIPCLRLECL